MEDILDGANPKTVGERIQLARNRKRYSATELGERIGVSHVTILSVEKGEKFSRQTLVALAKELEEDFTVTWLQTHLKKYTAKSADLNEVFEDKIRKIVKEEMAKEKRETIVPVQSTVRFKESNLSQPEVDNYSEIIPTQRKKAG
jgi:transcriptional regulator with XRE-family HTH domain